MTQEEVVPNEQQLESTDVEKEERENLIKACRQNLATIGIPQEQIDAFLSLNHTIKTLRKMKMPTKQEWEEYSKLPKDLDSLRKIKFPLLCGWSTEELIEALQPFILEHTKRYYTNRCDIADCKQNGAYGIAKALRTDAGLAPFAFHAYSRIRTSVRRPSAEAGIISAPEKRPSAHEVRIKITAYLASNLTAADLIEEKVQRTGEKNATEKMIRNSYKFNNVQSDTMDGLLEHLGDKFGIQVGKGEKSRGVQIIKGGVYEIVADLVGIIAIPPDFHGNPTSLDYGIEDESQYASVSDSRRIDGSEKPISDPAKIVEEDDFNRAISAKLAEAKEAVKPKLSPKQLVVFNALHGDNPINGTELAKNFGQYSNDGTLKVSRQRIAQYQAAIQKKILDALWESICNDSHYQKIIGKARPEANLTDYEDSVLVLALGLEGSQIYELDEIAENYECLTHNHLPMSDLEWMERKAGLATKNDKSRLEFVSECYEQARMKIMRSLCLR